MSDQELSGGAPAPVTDANASQAEATTDVVEQTPGSEAESSPAAKVPSDEPKPLTGLELRNKELTRRLREAERRYERVLRIAEERGTTPPPPPQQTQAAPQPKGLKDFNYDETAYREHLFTEAANRAATVAEQKAREAMQQQTAAARRAAYEAKAEAFASTVEDFEEVIQGHWACSQPMAEAIEESDEGPALAYYLAQNPDVSAKLAKLSAVQAARELTRIEDRLVSERKSAAQKPVSKAPPPAPQIDAKEASTRVSTTSPESDAMTDEEWVKAEQARLRRKAQRQASH
jgi:hypothetical protein